VILSADGVPTSEIMTRVQTTYPTTTRWRRRYAEKGVEGLCKDARRPGRKPRITTEQVREVVERTLHSTPLNGTHWSTRTMAAATGLSKATIQRLWRDHGLQPHRTETFKLSRDPYFLEKLQDVVGLYLDPPEKAVVFSVDARSRRSTAPSPACQ
jgi:transposase